MKTYNFYVDQKCTVWVRHEVEMQADTIEEAGQKLIDQVKNNLSEVLIEAESYETLYDTLEGMSPEENDGCSTIEVMQPNTYNSIYDNSISMADKQTPEAVNAELLEALEELVSNNYGEPRGVTVPALDKARAAIAKAKGGAA